MRNDSYLCSTHCCLFHVVFSWHDPQMVRLIMNYLLHRINFVGINCRLMHEFCCDWKTALARVVLRSRTLEIVMYFFLEKLLRVAMKT